MLLCWHAIQLSVIQDLMQQRPLVCFTGRESKILCHEGTHEKCHQAHVLVWSLTLSFPELNTRMATRVFAFA